MPLPRDRLLWAVILASGQGATVQKNHPTVGRIVNGVSIEREISYENVRTDSMMISLKDPDFTTARRIAERINEVFRGAAFAKDGGTINIILPADMKNNPVKFISMVENIDVKPDILAKIVVDEKTGTIVIGENVRISTVAISHGNLSVQIKEDAESKPAPAVGKGRDRGNPGNGHQSGRREGTFLSDGRWYYHQRTCQSAECRGSFNEGCYYHTPDH